MSILGEMIQFRRASPPQAKTVELENGDSKLLVEVVSQASCRDPTKSTKGDIQSL